MNKKVSIVTCAFLLTYYLFTSGLVFEVTKSESMNRIDTPISIALSNHRVSAVGLYTADDIKCMKWLMNEGTPKVTIRLDYNSLCLLNEYTQDRSTTYERVASRHYLFLNSDNIKNNRLVLGYEAGMRVYQPLPDTSNNEIVFKSGDAAVYKCNFGKHAPITLENSAILFIDVWAEAPIEYWETNASEHLQELWLNWWNEEVIPRTGNKILPLLEFARENGIAVVFVNGAGWKLASELRAHKFDEVITRSPNDLDEYLKGRGINTILYAGYATNVCILSRPTGMRAMNGLGYNVVLIEDCALSGSEVGYTHEQAIDEINEWFGGTVTFDELQRLVR